MAVVCMIKPPSHNSSLLLNASWEDTDNESWEGMHNASLDDSDCGELENKQTSHNVSAYNKLEKELINSRYLTVQCSHNKHIE